MKDESLDDILSDDQDDQEPNAQEPLDLEPQNLEGSKPDQEPAPEPEPEAPEPVQEPDKAAGLQAALTEERNKRRELEAQLETKPDVTALQSQVETLAAQLAQQQQKPQEPVKLPDPLENPEEFNGQLSNTLQQQRLAMLLDVDEKLARASHGDKMVNEAFQAAQAQGIISQFEGTQDGWTRMTKWYADQKTINQVNELGGVEKMREQIRAEVLAEVQANAVADAVAPDSPSLAAETNVGRQPTPKTQSFTNESLKDLLGNAHDDSF